MGLIFIFTGIILSIIKANNWCYIPFFCLSFCWVVGIFYVFVYGFSKTLAKNIVKDIDRQIKLESNEEKKEKLEQAKKVYENTL